MVEGLRQLERRKPSRTELRAAYGKRLPDVIAPQLKVLFVGINPSLYSGAVGHHFARPGNRFWPALHAAGFTARQLSPFDEYELLALGYGVTNLVNRATAAASELSPAELLAGAKQLRRKIRKYRPSVVAFVGVTAYRIAFGHPRATFGPQPDKLDGAAVWVLPNPSGLNAHFQLHDLARSFGELRRTLDL